MSELPYNTPGEYVLNVEEEPEHAQITLAWIELLHVFATCGAILLAMVAALVPRGGEGLLIAGAISIACLIGLLISRSIGMLIGDFYRQFGYREKFGIFLVHVVVFFSPWLLFGVHQVTIYFGALLVALCFQAMNQLFFARIYAISMAVMTLACFAYPEPSWVAVVGWIGCLCMAVRLGHVRFRIEDLGEERGIEMVPAVVRSLWVALLPAAVAWCIYAVTGSRLVRRQLPGMHIDLTQPSAPASAFSVSSLIWDGVIICALFIATFLLLGWIDRTLRKRKPGSPEEPNDVTTKAKSSRLKSLAGEGLSVDPSSGPRERILSAFRKFSERLARIELGRLEGETVPAYFQRLASVYTTMRPVVEKAAPPFERACYDERQPTDQEADAFVHAMETGIAVVRREIEERHDSGHRPRP